jgi:RsiW-degrading membrane proteinase PrsW (M82 family)
MESNIFLQQFIGHFIGAGLMEELFKVIPVFVFVIFKNKFNHLHLSGLSNGKVSPVLTMLIGVSSAVGFIFLETIFDYVPRFAAEQGEIIGLALLIPRFISGIAGHVGFTGIFSYYIGLAFYYKKFNPMLLIIGWVLPSMLHGLWNASTNIIISSSVAITTFTIFMIYLIKAKKSFPT